MDSFELNKLLAALLGTLFVVMSVGIIADSIFAEPVPANPGYAIAAAEAEAGIDRAEGEEEEPVAVLLASASPEAGEAVFKKCAACHTAESGGANKVGPNLWDIVNRPVASHEGFGYSAGMRAFAEGGTVWDYENLSSFLLSPKGVVKGTAMAFAGLKKPEERAAVIAYLRTFSDNPAPLPEVAAEEASAPAEGEAPAEGTAPAEGEAPAEPTEPAPAEPSEAEPTEPLDPLPAEPLEPAAEPSQPAPAEGAAPAQ